MYVENGLVAAISWKVGLGAVQHEIREMNTHVRLTTLHPGGESALAGFEVGIGLRSST